MLSSLSTMLEYSRARHRRRDSTTVRQQSISFLFLPRHHYRPRTIVAQLQLRPTSQTLSILRHRAENAKTDAADEACIHDFSMAEASCSEIHIDARRQYQVQPRGLGGQERHHQVLQKSAGGRVAEGNVDTPSGIARLLQEHGGAGPGSGDGNLADVDGDGEALAGEDGVHDGDVLVGEVVGGADGDEEDARVEYGFVAAVGGGGGDGGGGGVHGVGGSASGFSYGEGLAVDVAEGEGQGAGYLGG